MLDEAYKKVKIVDISKERFEIPKVEGTIANKNTIITNIYSIADKIRRPAEQLAKFLQKTLAVYASLEPNRLVLKTQINSAKVNEKVELFVKEFVICDECKKPDTEIISEKGIKYKSCLACGAKSPIKRKI